MDCGFRYVLNHSVTTSFSVAVTLPGTSVKSFHWLLLVLATRVVGVTPNPQSWSTAISPYFCTKADAYCASFLAAAFSGSNKSLSEPQAEKTTTPIIAKTLKSSFFFISFIVYSFNNSWLHPIPTHITTKNTITYNSELYNILINRTYSTSQYI